VYRRIAENVPLAALHEQSTCASIGVDDTRNKRRNVARLRRSAARGTIIAPLTVACLEMAGDDIESKRSTRV
jgi:hypothetical protein